MSKCFETLCTYPATKHSTTTAYHLQSNGQAKQYNKTIIDRLRHYVANHQREWDSCVHLFPYTYNVPVHRLTTTTPFSLEHLRQPQGLTTSDNVSEQPTSSNYGTLPQSLCAKLSNQIRAEQSRVDDRLKTAQNRYKQNIDAKARRIQTLTLGQKVSINRSSLVATQSQNVEQLAQSVHRKLMQWALGPFRVASMTLHTLTIEKNRIYHTVTVDWASSALNQTQRNNTTQHKAQSTALQQTYKRLITVDPNHPKSKPSTA